MIGIRPSVGRVSEDDWVKGGLHYLREKYASGFITLEEFEEGVHSVLTTGVVNVPRASKSEAA